MKRREWFLTASMLFLFSLSLSAQEMQFATAFSYKVRAHVEGGEFKRLRFTGVCPIFAGWGSLKVQYANESKRVLDLLVSTRLLGTKISVGQGPVLFMDVVSSSFGREMLKRPMTGSWAVSSDRIRQRGLFLKRTLAKTVSLSGTLTNESHNRSWVLNHTQDRFQLNFGHYAEALKADSMMNVWAGEISLRSIRLITVKHSVIKANEQFGAWSRILVDLAPNLTLILQLDSFEGRPPTKHIGVTWESIGFLRQLKAEFELPEHAFTLRAFIQIQPR